MKLLSRQMAMFEGEATSMEVANQKAAQRNEAAPDPPLCAWGDCARAATVRGGRSGEAFCRLNIKWMIRA